MLWRCIFKLKNVTLFVSFRLNSLVSELAAAVESSTLKHGVVSYVDTFDLFAGTEQVGAGAIFHSLQQH
jgi:hypothetical protein